MHIQDRAQTGFAIGEDKRMRRMLREWHWQRLKTPLAQLQLLVLDVDGVLTDGGYGWIRRVNC